MANILPKFIAAFWFQAAPWGGRLAGATTGVPVTIREWDKVEVLASFAVAAKTFCGEVDAGLCFIVDGDVAFVSYFVVIVREGALNVNETGTFSL